MHFALLSENHDAIKLSGKINLNKQFSSRHDLNEKCDITILSAHHISVFVARAGT